MIPIERLPHNLEVLALALCVKETPNLEVLALALRVKKDISSLTCLVCGIK